MSIKNIISKLKCIFKGSSKNSKVIGKIKFFDRKKGFGFIISGEYEYFFHAGSTKPQEHKALQDGATVRFDVIQGKKGPQADNVEIV